MIIHHKGAKAGRNGKHGAKRFADHGYFLPAFPGTATPDGTSPICLRSAAATLVAPWGGANTKLPAAAALVRQSLIWTVYCGASFTVLLVMTYLRGTGLGPASTHNCQSVSGV